VQSQRQFFNYQLSCSAPQRALPLRLLQSGKTALDMYPSIITLLERRSLMLQATFLRLACCATFMAAAMGCVQSNMPVPKDLQKEIALGESIFYQRDCGKCHQAGGFPKADEAGPKLSSVFFAKDTMHVKYHLYHIGRTDMPVIPLTAQEISAVTQFIASLHAKAYTPANLNHVDTRCPVCGATLNKAEAVQNSLYFTHRGKFYYFECPECKELFRQDPNGYARSGYVRDGKY
jgi:YHS domain-containing protein/mono/diheme cytochrome c family protein